MPRLSCVDFQEVVRPSRVALICGTADRGIAEPVEPAEPAEPREITSFFFFCNLHTRYKVTTDFIAVYRPGFFFT